MWIRQIGRVLTLDDLADLILYLFSSLLSEEFLLHEYSAISLEFVREIFNIFLVI